MIRGIEARATIGTLGAAVLLVVLAACGAKLPEPESEGAQLYVQYCSGQGCHGPIPPQQDSIGYWNNQYDRMIVLMRTEWGWPLPDAEQDRKIRDYLEKHALK
jgi:hypothetical protein